jgi:hypothetical protein
MQKRFVENQNSVSRATEKVFHLREASSPCATRPASIMQQKAQVQAGGEL